MNSRWLTAIHEAGHGVASIALGGECLQLVVYHDATGLASLDCLSPTDRAIAVAAAAAAEELLSDVQAPEAPAPESFHIREHISEPTPAEKLESIAARFPASSTPTDEHCIAHFCISGLEDELPERWVQRFYFIHAVASRVVQDHRDAILRVASELFVRGVLSKLEIQEVMK